MPDKVIGIINYLGPNGEIGETQDFTDVNEYLSGIEKAFDEYGINGWRYVTQTNDLDVNYKVYVLASGEFGKEPISRKAFHLQHPEYVLPPVTFGVVEDTPWGRMKVVRQQDFDKAFAQGATDFSNCYFEDVTFSGEAAEISFQNSILANGCQFDHAHFKGASFDGASIYCSIQDCDLSRSSFLHTTINGHIKRTDLSGCFFKDSHINKTSFADCILNRCIMYETALNSTYFVRCEAFGLQHMDTMRLTMGGATDREVENYIRQVTEALTPKAYEDLFCQIRAEISNGRFHIYDIEHSSTPLVGEGSVPQGLTPEAAAKQWLRGPNGAPYRMRGVHAYENLLEIPEDKRLVELDHDTFQWCPRKEVALSGIDQALSQYVKTWRQQEQPKGASTPKSNAERKSAVDIAKEQIQNLCNSFKKDPQQYVEYLKFSARFYKYSGRNMMLIYHQKPSANFVASRTAFKDMGYDLKPGQWKYPAWIIRPETKTLFVTADGVVADIKCATAQEKADIRDGKIPTEKFTYFRAAKVYEIGQTTCPAKDYVYNYRVFQTISQDLADQYFEIILMDTVCLNADRHTNNYGVLRNPNTGEILCLAPNFDNNIALISRGYSPTPRKPDIFGDDLRTLQNETNAAGLYAARHPLPVVTASMIDQAYAATGMQADLNYLHQFVLTGYQQTPVAPMTAAFDQRPLIEP